MKKRNCLLGQSGGPTAVINSSYRGILDHVKKSEDLDRIYAMKFGLEGLLAGKFFDMTDKSKEELELLKNTPSTVIGTSRYKLAHYDEGDEEYIKFFNFLEEHQIGYVFYVGGNDSMDSVAKLSSYAKEKGIDVKIMGIPKTIDNDIVITDHCPGYGSAAKYIATSVMEIARDSRVYDLKNVHIIEAMGRDTGWLAASSILAANEKLYAPDFIYLPEAVFDVDKFYKDVENKMKEQKAVTVVISEGIKDKNGEYISAGKSTAHDQFKHKKLGGAADALKPIIKENLCDRVKAIKFDVMQRAAAHCASGRDIVEAYQVGAEAVRAALEGETGKMTALKRVSNDPYQVEIIKVEAEKVANEVKYVPDKWINEQKNGLTEEFKDYVLPLIQGDIDMKTENSLPVFSKLEAWD